MQFQLDVVGIFEIIGDKPSKIRTSAIGPIASHKYKLSSSGAFI